MASIGGDLSEEEQKHTNEIVKLFAKKLREYARTLQIPASNIKINKCSFCLSQKTIFLIISCLLINLVAVII